MIINQDIGQLNNILSTLCFLTFFQIFLLSNIIKNYGKFLLSCQHLLRLEIQVNVDHITKKIKENINPLKKY